MVKNFHISSFGVAKYFPQSIFQGKLPSEAVLTILEELAKSGNATPLDKSKQRWLVYWHTLEEWGEIIYNWAQVNGFIGSVCTMFELTQGENTTDQGKVVYENEQIFGF